MIPDGEIFTHTVEKFMILEAIRIALNCHTQASVGVLSHNPCKGLVSLSLLIFHQLETIKLVLDLNLHSDRNKLHISMLLH